MVGILDRLAAGFSVRTSSSEQSSETDKKETSRVSIAPQESKLNTDAVVTDFSSESEESGVINPIQAPLNTSNSSPLDNLNNIRDREESRESQEAAEREAPEANRTPRRNLGNTPNAQVDRNTGFDKRNQNFGASQRVSPERAPTEGQSLESRSERVATEIQRESQSEAPEDASAPENQISAPQVPPPAAERIEIAATQAVSRVQDATQAVAELDRTIEAAASASGGSARAAEVAAVVEETEVAIEENNRDSAVERDLRQNSQPNEAAAKQADGNPAKAASKLNTTA